MAGYVDMERVAPGARPVHRSHRVVRMLTPMAGPLVSIKRGEHVSIAKAEGKALIDSGQAVDPNDGDAGRGPAAS